MTLFRPVLDLHEGKVKQIVGATLTGDADALQTNFVAEQSAGWFADLYQKDGLTGGHLIMLGPGNEAAALEAVRAYPGGLQVGGGITPETAGTYLEAGAPQVIVTSWLFDAEARLDRDRLAALAEAVGKDRLVLDLSCRREGDGWRVAMNRWQTPTDCWLTHDVLAELAGSCAEYLIHAADVEGKCEGIDEDLVRFLGQGPDIPITYAGGARSLDDLSRVEDLSGGRVDLAIGSALDLFGGKLISYQDCLAYNRSRS